MDHADVADDVGHQHRGHVVALVLMDIAHRSGDASVVDQDVEMPRCPLDDVGRAPHRAIRRHVQLNELGASCLCGSMTAVRVTGTEIYAVPGANQSPYRLQADSLVGSRDQAHVTMSHRCRHH
jgi:hypothetical protein